MLTVPCARPRRRCAVLASLAVLAAASTVAAPSPWGQPAAAQPGYPSQEEVDRSRQAVAGTAAEVGAVEARLAAGTARLEELEVAAGVAAEDHNDAVVALQRRTEAAEEARATADGARAAVEVARLDVGRLAATSYRSGGSLAGLEAFLDAGGPQELLDKAAAVDALGRHRQRAYQRVDATELVARLLDEQAQAARAAQQEAADVAEAARQRADRAATAAQGEVARVQRTRGALLARLAELRSTSVELEARRQQGLEEERRRREEAAARAEVERREAAEAARIEERRRAEEQQRASRSRSAPGPAPAAAPTNPARTRPASSASSASAGDRALAWAAAQIGKDYQWGASGPDTFDCSGLTSRAWRDGAGTWITRTSRSQWAAVGKVPYSQMRPGDLIFYATDPSDPSSIWHVTIYAGDGMMIEAPRTGLQVREVPVRWTNAMPQAGRP